jgi:hypothetical protein
VILPEKESKNNNLHKSTRNYHDHRAFAILYDKLLCMLELIIMIITGEQRKGEKELLAITSG